MAKPLGKYSMGQVSITVWPGMQEGWEPSYTINKSYKDKSGEWKQTNNLSLKELLQLQPLINEVAAGKIKKKKAEEPKQQQQFEGNSEDVPF